MDQLLLPALEEKFGLRVERELRRRGWGHGPRGNVWVKVSPLAKGLSLIPLPEKRDLSDPRSFVVESVDVNLVVPVGLQVPLQTALARDLSSAFPAAEIHFKVVEDSGHPARAYLLLVAKSPTGLRWGRDILHESSKKPFKPDTVAANLSRQAVKQLSQELESRGEVDVYLQDQLVCFQALAAGSTSVVRHDRGTDVDDATSALGALEVGSGAAETHDAPFGPGSLHTKTVRWIAVKLLPGVRFLKNGDVVEGARVKFGEEFASRMSAGVPG